MTEAQVHKNKLKRVLFVCPIWAVGATFVTADFGILKKHFGVTRIAYATGDLFFVGRILKHLLINDICYVWFGGVHAFWAVLLGKMAGKRTVVVSGGYDTVYIPEIGYGIKFEKQGWRRCYWALRNASATLAFSRASLQALHNEPRSKNATMVHLGFDLARIPEGLPWKDRRNGVITTCHMSVSNIARKGLDTFIATAQLLPDVRFTLVGRDHGAVSTLSANCPSNVEFAGYLPEELLYRMLGQIKLYAQLSAHEGFGCALAEAMACGCLPIVTDRGSLPEVAGEDALYVPYADSGAVMKRIQVALSNENVAVGKFRLRIAEQFSASKREDALCACLSRLIR